MSKSKQRRKNYVSVCKNTIASNNKAGWIDPAPAIRISETAKGCGVAYANEIGITDAEGNIVARLVSTVDGKPVLKCGAKVALITDNPVKVLS